MEGAAAVAETEYTPFQDEPDAVSVRLIVRRVKPTPGSQLALFTNYSYHGFITDREGDTLDLEADHRRHAEIENAIRRPRIKCGAGSQVRRRVEPSPLGALRRQRSLAGGAGDRPQPRTLDGAHRSGREQVVTTKTLRRRFFSLAGRLTRSARRLTLHLPRRWPWENQFSGALARLRAIPLPA